ncbi:MAG TPA: 4'-phosphopantetheinyl transferase superfamily protein [Solirubrobacteraceae bacterium]|jgi:4'-phosphopantetheinyl transferase EntD|nr:4'-phosphopantetheinyl transferase superfamily protein [Solirubrobacteraceae bacterium]
MIEEILPDAVIAVEARGDDLQAQLFAEEEIVVRRAVEKRRNEFATARGCARRALAQLGYTPTAIATGERGEPLWPAGAVGSITHCEGYRACAVAQVGEVATVGIDAEPNAALPDGILGDIARPEELPDLMRLQEEIAEIHWGRLLFSAKESIYKAWYPVAKRWLGFEDAIVKLDLREGTFAARLLVAAPALGQGSLAELSGRWLVRDGLILTAIVVPAR